MRFEVSSPAAALRDAAADVLRSEVTPALIRDGWPGGDAGAVDGAWRKLAGIGVVGTLVPEAHGGLGLDEIALVTLLHEIGRSGMPVPVVETIAVAAPVLAAAGEDRLAAVLDGEILVAADFDGRGLLPYGARAALSLFGDARTLRVFDRDELDLAEEPTVDGGRPVARVLGQRAVGRELVDDPAIADTAWQRGVLGTAAVLVGLARRMLELTVDYVSTREQYGVPVGSFQAIKHALADALVAVEFAGPMVAAAAWSQAAGSPDAARRTSAAKVLAGDAARKVARTAIQCHGAMGYTTEYDLHLFAKRVWALAPSWGDATSHRARLADALGV